MNEIIDLCILNDPDKNKRRKILEVLESFGYETVFSLKRHIDDFTDMDQFFWVDSGNWNFSLEVPMIKYWPIRPWTKLESILTIDEFLEKFPFEIGDMVLYSNSNWKIIKKYWNVRVGTVEYDLMSMSDSKEILEKIPAEKLIKFNDYMIVKFLKNGDLYKVLEENSEMKHPESREWIPSVIYQSYKKLVNGEYVEVTEPKVYVRERQEFFERFLPALDF